MQTITLESLRRLPAFAAMLADAETAALKKRQATIDAWHASNEQARKDIAELETIERKRTQEAEKLAAELKAAIEKRDQARLALMGLANKHHRAAIDAEQRIIAGADSRLLHFINWTHRAGNLAGFASHRAGIVGYSGAVPDDGQARAASQSRKVASLVDSAVARAEEMRRLAISEADMLAELDAMASAIRAAFAPLASFGGGLPAEHTGQPN